MLLRSYATVSAAILPAVLSLLAAAASSCSTTAVAFVPVIRHPRVASRQLLTSLGAEQQPKNAEGAGESAFVPIDATAAAASADQDDEEDDDTEDTLDKVELLGRGAAKVKRGKRKGTAGKSTSAALPQKTNLAPEQVFYEGPPAITETIVPTISILTVVGIIPAAAAWARQAWVRYKITNRRIRVTSGIGGREMAEIVYPDIVELRTARRLFGDGDMVAYLRDGAKFEMRNIPEFEKTVEFILQQVDDKVVQQYRAKGDVTRPQ